MSDNRTATDVLLNIESMVLKLNQMISNLDLNLKILSNKVNSLSEIINNKNINNTPSLPSPILPSVSVDSGKMHPSLINNRSMIKIDPFDNIPITEAPAGNRRGSRETVLQNQQPIQNSAPNLNQVKISDPFPPSKEALASLQKQIQNKTIEAQNNESKSSQNFNNSSKDLSEQFTEFTASQDQLSNKIALTQRVVDKNGKSVFLADVRVLNAEDNSLIFKARTNGVGKWQASVPAGNFKVFISKTEPITKSKMESSQSIIIDGRKPSLTLEPIILQ